MDASEGYVSSIPVEAKTKATGKYDNGRPTRVEYYLGKEKVGLRIFSRDGDLEIEYSFRNGQYHGWSYRWDEPAKLLSATPYQDGVEHGTAYQWADDGRLLGTYRMEHGTGTDLWWEEWDGIVSLAEAFQMQDGLRNGHEWWFHTGKPGQLWIEKQWFTGKQHGIEREWNSKGRLSRGYPRYWIHDQRVAKRQYVRAAAKDPTLPPFRAEDNVPHRDFPPEIDQHLHGTSRG